MARRSRWGRILVLAVALLAVVGGVGTLATRWEPVRAGSLKGLKQAVRVNIPLGSTRAAAIAWLSGNGMPPKVGPREITAIGTPVRTGFWSHFRNRTRIIIQVNAAGRVTGHDVQCVVRF